MRKNSCLLILLPVLCLCSCKYALHEAFYRDFPVAERSNKVEKIECNDLDVQKDTFSFVVISDVHFGAKHDRPDSQFLEKIAQLNPRPYFCLCLGDVAEHGLEEEYKEYNSVIVDKLAEMGIKTFSVVGNHDLYNSGWKNFTTYNFPYTSSYCFTYNGYSFYGIDSASGNLSKPQMDALKKEFEKDSNKKVIFSHVPLYAEDTLYFIMQDSEERNELISLFAENDVKLFLGGHIHEYLQTDFGTFKEVNVPAFLEQFGWSVFTINVQNEEILYDSTMLK